MEQGSHPELIARPGGAYATLVGLQMSALGAKKENDEDDVVLDEMVRPHQEQTTACSGPNDRQ